ncbi:MAG: hypothetical protein ABIK28_08565, partial [Planctomycetota bacterium]
NYLCHLLVEAYAARGGLVIPWGDYDDEAEARLGRFTAFLRCHADLFEKTERAADVAVLYARGTDSITQHGSYLGAAQALNESCIPNEVLYISSDPQDATPLSLGSLRPYNAIVYPFKHTLSDDQQAVVLQYTVEGGTVVLLEADHSFPVPHREGKHPFGKGGFMIMGSGSDEIPNLGEAYFRAYSDDLRTELSGKLLPFLSHGIPVSLPGNGRGAVALAYSRSDPEGAVIHLLNYDYDPDRDLFRPVEPMEVRIRLSSFATSFPDRITCTAYSPDRAEPLNLACTPAEAEIVVSLPRLDMYEVLLIQGEAQDGR